MCHRPGAGQEAFIFIITDLNKVAIPRGEGTGRAKQQTFVWQTMANDTERRYGPQGLHGLSLKPGGILTGLQMHVPDGIKKGWGRSEDVGKCLKSPEQDASTTVYAALSKDWEGKGGTYLEDCGVAEECKSTSQIAPGYAPYVCNEEGEKRLWADSLRFVGLDGGE